MPIRVQVDNTYYIFDSTAGRVTNWPAAARVAQIRLVALTTAAAASWEITAGTPWFQWTLVTNATGAALVAPGYYTFPMGGMRMPDGPIFTTLTACSAWFDFI